MKPLAAAALALSLAGCAYPVAGNQDFDTVAFSASSWGRVLSGWTVGSSGAGSWYERINEDGTQVPFGAYRITYHDFQLDPAARAELQRLLAKVPDPVPDAEDCINFRTDSVYGGLKITYGSTSQEVRYDEGCEDADYVAYLGTLHAIDTLIEGAGRATPAARVEHFSEDGKGVSHKVIDDPG